jgi:nucleotide-binding universal stress UspA family protein
MKVLIGYDGSDSARQAIVALRRAGLPRDTEARVISVADVPPQRAARGGGADEGTGAAPTGWQQAPIVQKAQAMVDEAAAQALALAAEGAELCRAEFPSWTVSHEAAAGSPYLALVEPSPAADLLVVGSRGRSPVGRLLLGSVSRNVLTHAACSVRVSRGGEGGGAPPAAADAPVRIVLGVDGSPDAALAVSAVAARAWPAGTEVRAVAVLDAKFWTALANPQVWAWVAPAQEDGRSWASRAVEAVARELRSAGLLATPMIEEGDPKHVLVEQAQRWQADCIFVGAKGHARLERFLLGSVSAAVAERAHCSVEVVRQE